MEVSCIYNERMKKTFTFNKATKVYRGPGPAHTASVHASVQFCPANAENKPQS